MKTRYGIMPRSIKAVLQEHLNAEGQFDRLHDFMFFDDAASDGAGVDVKNLVRRASRIASRSNDCSRMLSDESAWNNQVHSPLLDMLTCDMRDGPDHDILDFLSW